VVPSNLLAALLSALYELEFSCFLGHASFLCSGKGSEFLRRILAGSPLAESRFLCRFLPLFGLAIGRKLGVGRVQIFDRMDAEVLVFSEDRDNFITKMLTVRAESRLALAVRKPTAFVKGTLVA
jgi:hypothetical protein